MQLEHYKRQNLTAASLEFIIDPAFMAVVEADAVRFLLEKDHVIGS